MKASAGHIHLARRADAASIAACSRDLIETGLGWRWRPERVLRSIINPEAVVLKSVQDDQMSGFAIMRFGWEEAHLDLLAVQPHFQRQGIGSALLRWLEESALTAGIGIVRLEVRETNLGARRFYQRHGYRRFATATGYYQSREAAVRMARDLWCGLPVDAA